MKITIGVFAHVDAGKTTFCEGLLYQTNRIKFLGRVDHGSSVMDHNEVERRRGITIFSDIASFSYADNDYWLVDTPGHIDFSAEMERTIAVLDAAILIISAPNGVQSHSVTIHKLLQAQKIPVYIFINKIDQLSDVDIDFCMEDINKNLGINSRVIGNIAEIYEPTFVEWLCEYDNNLLEHFLDETHNEKIILAAAKNQIKSGNISLAVAGSALHQQGILETIAIIGETLTETPQNNDFSAAVFKVIHDKKGAKVTFIKCLSGKIAIKDEIFYNDIHEKINEIRSYQGKSYTKTSFAAAGDIVGVLGLSTAIPGMLLGDGAKMIMPTLQPALKAAVVHNLPHDAVMDCLRKIEQQDPMLKVDYVNHEINVCIMGKIQLEVLKELALEDFGIALDFSDCSIMYKETVAEPIMGYGHFEPLRHYAEVHLRIEPNPKGGCTFASEVHVDNFPKQYQNLVEHHVLERDHKGVLTGSSLTDVKIVLTKGAIHLKHTHGGDLKEATYRAVRQGLEKAENIILEPYYSFIIYVDTPTLGRVLSDITAMHGTFEPPETLGDRACIKGSGPVATFLNYSAELLSFTKGTGAISLWFLDYFPCHNPQEVIAKIGYQKERDMENTSSSVFLAKGAGFEVQWDRAEEFMQLM
ncbi:MAG: TetM/TetW/TetO/TetS family tetracycline resistance ribosomal protection protein [Defluviitaleaceae bacterium]|nr:TetM/TetW/TetO/TetS family tetracycline resistance ribosomal protection protein [Defluviitaleaceae bacterium]